MPVRDIQHEYIDVTAFGDNQKTYLVVRKPADLGVHVAFGAKGTNPVCIGCGCCNTRGKDPFYCGQCLRGVPRP